MTSAARMVMFMSFYNRCSAHSSTTSSRKKGYPGHECSQRLPSTGASLHKKHGSTVALSVRRGRQQISVRQKSIPTILLSAPESDLGSLGYLGDVDGSCTETYDHPQGSTFQPCSTWYSWSAEARCPRPNRTNPFVMAQGTRIGVLGRLCSRRSA